MLRGLAILAVVVVVLQCCELPRRTDGRCVLFNFGDSNSDTGSLPAAYGFYLGPPAGRRFFHRTTGRWSDGRLYIDFIAESLGISYLSPYLESSGSNFTDGVNFAVAGAAAASNQSAIPFPMATQVEDAVRALYGAGGRKFWVYNTGPLGCLPQTLALRQKPGDEVDPVGCLAAYNTAARALNAGLAAACRRLADEYGRGERVDRATVVCTDMYAIKYDLFANHSQYGFERPLMACCGNGGPPYNYVNLKTCGQPTATACPEGERYVSWDGVHYTEDANTIVASKILSGDFSEPCAKLDALCT
ncbi:hypothetical protein QYE76_009308 [Lolium multiflorum]|uniref:GDSL esterase/lipase n=1 Tax=Lolium multiflorum TaxID=4521 RepID=A0AAD8X149_LOLMU|nr:hypothetical protein QYE76_009308 [Lolium multiflorum]